ASMPHLLGLGPRRPVAIAPHRRTAAPHRRHPTRCRKCRSTRACRCARPRNHGIRASTLLHFGHGVRCNLGGEGEDGCVAELAIDPELVVWSAEPEARDQHPLVVVMHGRGSDERDLASLFPLLPSGFVYASLRAPFTFG